MYDRCNIDKVPFIDELIDWLTSLRLVTAQCIQNPNAYLAKRLTSTKVGLSTVFLIPTLEQKMLIFSRVLLKN